MASMAYCAFENTRTEMDQCVSILENGGPDSDSEKRYAKMLCELCERYIDAYGELCDENGDIID